MDLHLETADQDSRVLLERLLQLHLYEMGMAPGPDGLIDWGEALDDYVSVPDRLALLLKFEDKVVGFALAILNHKWAGLDGHTQVVASLIEEFHILRPFRRRKLGVEAVGLLLREHPGRWMVTTWPGGPRVEFWHHVVALHGGTEYSPNEHKGFPGQYAWVMEEDVSPEEIAEPTVQATPKGMPGGDPST